MPFIHFKDNSIEVKFTDGHNFLSEIEADYDIKMEMKEYSSGTVQGSLTTNDLYITLYPSDKLLRFNVEDSTLNIYLTEFQVNKISGFFRHGVYYELEVPESSASSLQNYDPPRNNMNTEDPAKRSNNNNNNNNNSNNNNSNNNNSNNPSINGGKRSTRRRKIKQHKSKRKTRK